MADLHEIGRTLDQLEDSELMTVLRKQFLTRPGYGTQAHLLSLLFNPANRQRETAAISSQDLAAVARRDEVDAAAIDAVLTVPHLGSTEAGQLLRTRGVLASSNASDALRKLAKSGRLIGLRHAHKWLYPRFQLDFIDPADDTNTVVVVNRLLDAGRFPWSATSWWTTPSGSLPGGQSPADLLGRDETTLLQLAQADAAGPDL